jgi:hypothetical protein
MQETSNVSSLNVVQPKALALTVNAPASKDRAIRSSSPGSSPGTPIDEKSNVTLRQALSNKDLHCLLTEFTQKVFKYEHLLLWDNIQMFRQTSASEIRLRNARFIFDTFLSPNNGFISASTSEHINFQLNQNLHPECLFDDLEKEVERDLENIFVQFVKSKEFIKYSSNGSSLVVVDKLTLVKRPTIPTMQKLCLNRDGLSLNVVEAKREMSPTVGNNERFVGSPTIKIDSVKSPTTIKSPTVGEMPRFVCSPVAPVIKQEERHKRVASPRDFLASLLLSFKKRKL